MCGKAVLLAVEEFNGRYSDANGGEWPYGKSKPDAVRSEMFLSGTASAQWHSL